MNRYGTLQPTHVIPALTEHQTATLPPIVDLVLRQVSRHRSEGTINDADFNEKISRLEVQELQPRGLVLSFNELSGGRMRFVVKAITTGAVQQTLEYPMEDLGGMLLEMQAAISQDGFYVLTPTGISMLWGGQELELSEKLRLLHRFAGQMELWVRSRSRVTSALFEAADEPKVDGAHWERTGEVRLLVEESAVS